MISYNFFAPVGKNCLLITLTQIFLLKYNSETKEMQTKFTCSKVLVLRIYKASKFLNSILKIPLHMAL